MARKQPVKRKTKRPSGKGTRGPGAVPRVQVFPIAELQAAPHNPRAISTEALAGLGASIEGAVRWRREPDDGGRAREGRR